MGNLQSQSQPGVDLNPAARNAFFDAEETYGRYIDALGPVWFYYPFFLNF